MNDSIKLPSLEMLETTHQFPGAYTFKVIGSETEGFVGRVVGVVREELGFSYDPPFTIRQTPAGRHVAVTLEPKVESAQQVLAVYSRLSQVRGVVMLF